MGWRRAQYRPRLHDHTDNPAAIRALAGSIHLPSRNACNCQNCSLLRNCRPPLRSASGMYIVQPPVALIPGTHILTDAATSRAAVGKANQNHGKPSRRIPERRGNTAAPTNTTITTANVHTHTMAVTVAPTRQPAALLLAIP